MEDQELLIFILKSIYKKAFSLFQSGFHGLFYPEMEDAGAFVWPFRGTLRQNEGISGAQKFP